LTSSIKYMARSGRGRSQTWKTFLHNHVAGIGAMDFLIVPTVGFRLLFVLVILRHERRRLISPSVTAHPMADWIARQITDAFPWEQAPDYMIRDRDGCYGQAVARRLAATGIRDHPTAPRSPWQNGHAERLISSIRRECLDHIVVFGEGHLRRILAGYARYYNELRMHLSLRKDSPHGRPVQRLGQLAAQPINIAGYSFRQGQGVGLPLDRGRLARRGDRMRRREFITFLPAVALSVPRAVHAQAPPVQWLDTWQLACPREVLRSSPCSTPA
jgi:Integrase core domain